jgi:hypothetical protein
MHKNDRNAAKNHRFADILAWAGSREKVGRYISDSAPPRRDPAQETPA